MPLPQLTDELNHIYGAFNAIDYALTCGLYELSRHPQWAVLIRQELRQVLGQRPYPGREDFGALTHTLNFMKEVFRYYPVALSVMRRTGQDLPVNGTSWPEGKEVMILLQSLHHHPDFWEQPELFNPNRWNQPLKEPHAYIPFLTGPRQCIGKHLAQVHFVVTLNAILQKFTLRVLDHSVPVKPYMNPRFAGKLPFVVQAPRPA